MNESQLLNICHRLNVIEREWIEGMRVSYDNNDAILFDYYHEGYKVIHRELNEMINQLEAVIS